MSENEKDAPFEIGCSMCMFGRKATITKKGEECEVYECHYKLPTRDGFNKVREDDFCSHFMNEKTGEVVFLDIVRAFNYGVAPDSMENNLI